jgi:HlyD family secretion protein
MIRRLIPLAIALGILVAFGWTLAFLYEKSKQEPIVYETSSAAVADIVEKTVAAGAIVPRREVAIKPRVSGILQKLLVEPGQFVKAGDRIAEIKIVPNVVSLNSAESRLEAARISARNRRQEHERIQRLQAQQLVSQAELNRAELEHQLARQELEAARNNLQLVKEGAIRGSGKISNIVESTVAGMVIEVPVKEGVSVIETNNFNEGTTIASIADMQDMIFKGYVDESEVGKLREDMPVSISIGAIAEEQFDGRLEYIAPKGTDREGTIEFEVRAALTLQPGKFVRANYSANADIILDRREHVLAINERLVQFEGGSPYVEVETGAHTFERRALELGLSDGVRVEVLDGLAESDAIKVPVAVKGTPPG